MAKATRTRRDDIVSRPSLETWHTETKTLYNQVVAFFELYQARPGLLDLDQHSTLIQVEKLTHRIDRNPNPLWPLHETVKADIPAMMRRAAINAARGAFKSFHSNSGRWQKQKKKFEAKGKRFHHRPPITPRVFNFNLPFYQGMFKDRTDTSLLVGLYSGTSWQWVKLRLAKQAERVPAGWEAGRPVLAKRRGRFRRSIAPHRSRLHRRDWREHLRRSVTSGCCSKPVICTSGLAPSSITWTTAASSPFGSRRFRIRPVGVAAIE